MFLYNLEDVSMNPGNEHPTNDVDTVSKDTRFDSSHGFTSYPLPDGIHKANKSKAKANKNAKVFTRTRTL
jgi:hypothetical protein